MILLLFLCIDQQATATPSQQVVAVPAPAPPTPYSPAPPPPYSQAPLPPQQYPTTQHYSNQPVSVCDISGCEVYCLAQPVPVFL